MGQEAVVLAKALFSIQKYSKCPKFCYFKVSDKISSANSVNPDQTAPEGAV